MNERILIACPISSHKDYVILQWAAHVKKIIRAYPGMCDVLLADNSNSSAHARKVERLTGLRCDYISTHLKNNYDAISLSRNYIRNYFLQCEYTHLFSLECDVFPPKNTLSYLLALNKDLVGFTYFLGAGENSPLMIQEFEETGDIRETQNLSLPGSIHFIDGTIKKVFSIGMGCLLISRRVLEKIPFRTDPQVRIHDDSFFAEDCKNKGFQIYCDTSVIPNHKNIPWNLYQNVNL